MSGKPYATSAVTLGLVALALAAGRLLAQAPVVMMTSQQDHDRQMRVLEISGFPPGPDPYQSATYDEASANPYPALPDPLLMNDGTKVTTAAAWTKRRAEIKELFDREVYGRVPANVPGVTWEVVSTERGLPERARNDRLSGVSPDRHARWRQ